MLCPWKCSILETVNELSLENQGRSPLIIILSEKLFTIHILMAPNKHVCLWACYPYHRSFFLVNPDLSYQRIVEEKGFIQRYYGKPFLASGIHKYLTGLFLKASFSSLDAVFTWTFLGTFCLNPHFLNTVNVSIIFFYCGFFSIIISSVQLVLWSNHSLLLLFFTEYFVFILYSLSVRIFVDVFRFLVCLLILPCLPHHIFSTIGRPNSYFYESLWLRGLQPYHGIQH